MSIIVKSIIIVELLTPYPKELQGDFKLNIKYW